MDRSVLRSTSSHVLVEPPLADEGGIVITDEVEHHLRKVLRLRDGEVVSVTDGEGRWRLGVVVVTGSALTIESTSAVVTEPERPAPIVVAASIPKGERLDWMVQKVTELGVDRLVLLETERSVVRWKPDRVEHQLGRLQRIADDALRQSRRVRRLSIDPPVRALDVLGGFVVAEPGGRRLRVGDRRVAVGPEGGWTEDELASAGDTVDLGDTILRTETAAAAVSALCVASER